MRIGSDFPHLGTASEYTIAHVSQVAFKPKNMSFEEAAAVPLAAVTGLQMLKAAKFKQGDKVFITAGAGGSSLLINFIISRYFIRFINSLFI